MKQLARSHEIVVLQHVVVRVRVDLVDRFGSSELGLARGLGSASSLKFLKWSVGQCKACYLQLTFFFPLALSLSSACFALPRTLSELETFLV